MEQQLISFILMFPEQLIEHNISETNRYASECITTKPDPGWKDTSLEEIKVFLGLHVLFGIKQLPSYKLYWSKDPLIGVPAVQKVMSRNRFEKLSQYFHVHNNANQVPREDPAYDRLFKVQPVINPMVQCCQMELMPERDLTVE